MTETTIKVNETVSIVKLTATYGMVLTNDEAYGKEIFLGKYDSPENWHEITEAEAEALMEEADDAEATTEDYQNALREMGVAV